MKTVCTAFIFLLTAISHPARAQGKREVQITYGKATFYNIADYTANGVVAVLAGTFGGVETDLSQVNHAVTVTCKQCIVKDKFSLGGIAGYDITIHKDGIDGINSKFKVMTIGSEGTYFYSRPGSLVKIFSSFGLGAAFTKREGSNVAGKRNAVSVNFHCSPLGLRIGRRYGISIEPGIGYKGLICAGFFYNWGS